MAANENLVSANQQLEAFSAMVSHDLRSPLNIVAGYTSLLQEDYASVLDAEAKEFLARINKSAYAMSKLIDDLLQFSRSAKMEVRTESVDLSEMVRNVAKELSEHDKERKADFNIEDGLVTLADPDLMRVVINNLLGNAWKYSGKVDHPAIAFGKIVSERETAYFIKDNGAGFDMAKATTMFTPFQRFHTNREFAGTGIGLATVRRIIERHGGRIWAESEPGTGATFFFSISEG